MAEPDSFEAFRLLISRRARRFPGQWEDSRRLIEKGAFQETMERLHRAVDRTDLPTPIKQSLLETLRPGVDRVQSLEKTALKALTGLPPTKAFRALCIYFDMLGDPGSRWPVPAITASEIEQALKVMENPFDLLLHSDVASVLDLGAGDLSFAGELVAQYLPMLTEQRRALVLHCLDRLQPKSQLGGPLHPQPDRLSALQRDLGHSFAFFGGQDMFALQNLDERGAIAQRYTITTCWAPATPTFAYEPTRFSAGVIQEHLRRTKGAFHQTRFHGEPALEVQHGDRALLFPAWKFDIVGPLALLRLMAERGALCVLGAVDAQVFWEVLSQLLEESRYRPRDEPFTEANIPEVFGEVYRALDELPIGGSIRLSDLAPLRSALPGAE
ncbi:MAG: hypothetical protein ICV75_06105, partial [Nitrospiraceae bacterium]|nr:hypothetical protein [Nitrospiraceae bacterium]